MGLYRATKNRRCGTGLFAGMSARARAPIVDVCRPAIPPPDNPPMSFGLAHRRRRNRAGD